MRGFQGEVAKWLHGVGEYVQECSRWLGDHDQWIKSEVCQELDMFVLEDIWNLNTIDIMTSLIGICEVIQGRLSNFFFENKFTFNEVNTYNKY